MPIKRLLSEDFFPSELFASASDTEGVSSSVLDRVFYTDSHVVYGDNSFGLSIDMLVPADQWLSISGLDQIAFGIGREGFFPFTAHIIWTTDNLELLLENIELTVRFSENLLLPAEIDPAIPPENPKYPQYRRKGDAQSQEKATLSATGSLYIDKDFDIEARGFDHFTLEPVKLPNLDSAYLVLEDVVLDLSRKSAVPEILAAGFDESYQGLYVRELTVVFQDELGEFLPDIKAQDFAIGTGGISGKLMATFDLSYHPDADPAQEPVFTGDAAGYLYGAHIGLRKFELELRANEVVSSEITGQMLLPFFDKPVEIELSLDLKGNISVGLKGVDGDILAELTKEDILSMKINSFAFSKQDKEIAFALGGSIKPLLGQAQGLDIPEFGVNSLTVSRNSDDKTWGVRIEGGWIDFPKALPFSIAGFGGELRKVGFGDLEVGGDVRKFVGFSGSVSFVSGFALAAEFDDLQLFYPDIGVELKRARIGLLIPNAVSLIGEVSKKDDGFGGMIDVSIIPTQIRVFGGAEFGHTPDFTYMQILMGLELPPPGIMLGPSIPVSIVGGEGKYAMNMGPSMDPGWEWAISPPRGIMPLSKMVPSKGDKMLALGLKLGTTDGHMLTINALMALMLPGPVVMIEGRGAILTDTFGGGSSADPPFYALIEINGNEQYFAANLSYSTDLAKGIVKASGTVSTFFDFLNSNNWYIRLGQKEPESKRIQATALAIFKAAAYFEVYAGPHLTFGAEIEFGDQIDFKVGYAALTVCIAGNVDLSWKPEHAAGLLTFWAEISARICGFGLGLSAFGEIDAKCPYPRHLEMAVGYKFFVNLPWPLPDVKEKGEIEKAWKDGSKYPCGFEPLVSEVLVDGDIPGIPAQALQAYPGDSTPQIWADLPLVPLDARPTLKFTYPMNDKTPLAFAGHAANGRILHKIGDDEYEFSLTKILLEERKLSDDLTEFNAALNAPFDPDAVEWTPVVIPYGVWIADNSATGYPAATTLRLFADTPFTHFRQTDFSGGTMQEYGVALESQSAAFLTDTLGTSNILDADTFSASMETDVVPTACDLTATMQDQTPGYPLGHPQAEWRYLGFANVPIQFQAREVEITNLVGILAVPDAAGNLRCFDVMELHFLPPAELMPEVHNVPTLVRGVYFEGAILIRFGIPVTECELFLYPVSRKSAGRDAYPEEWPDEGKPDERQPSKEGPFSAACCKKARAHLKKLAESIKEERAQGHLKELQAVIEKCCERKRGEELHDGGQSLEDCCQRAKAHLEQLGPVIKDQTAFIHLKELAGVINECCEHRPDEESGHDEPFLTFDFAPTPAALLKHPPRIRARRQRNGGSDTVLHEETREDVGNLYRVRITDEGTPFDEVEIDNTIMDQGLFLVAIGYLPDVQECYEEGLEKIKGIVDGAWSEDGDAPVVLSPRSCYRLTVTTDDGCGSPETQHVYYFRTDGPPAKFIEHYVAWTVPAAQDYPHFRNYDVSIRFRTNYVDQLYEGLPLQLLLKSASGTVRTAEIDNALAWRDEARHLLRPEEQVYLDLLNASDTVAFIDPEAIPGDKSLIMSVNSGSDGALEADIAYSALLRLTSESKFQLVTARVKGVDFYFQQHLPTTITAEPNPGTIMVGGEQLLGSSEYYRDIEVDIDGGAALLEFNFRTSRFLDFAAMFSHLVDGQVEIQPMQVPDDPGVLRTALNAVADVCQHVWRPSQMALREKKLLIQQRLAKDEDLLDLLDKRAEAGAKLDQAFNIVLSYLSDVVGNLLQPLPTAATLHFSPFCILVELPEPIEFDRVSVAYDAFDVLVVCSSDESRWLVFPVSESAQFSQSEKLALTYHLDIGNDCPTLRYGPSCSERVTIPLGV
jgi:hypothetical protein